MLISSRYMYLITGNENKVQLTVSKQLLKSWYFSSCYRNFTSEIVSKTWSRYCVYLIWIRPMALTNYCNYIFENSDELSYKNQQNSKDWTFWSNITEDQRNFFLWQICSASDIIQNRLFAGFGYMKHLFAGARLFPPRSLSYHNTKRLKGVVYATRSSFVSSQLHTAHFQFVLVGA